MRITFTSKRSAFPAITSGTVATETEDFTFFSGGQQFYVTTAMPEPAAIVLVLGGIGVLVIVEFIGVLKSHIVKQQRGRANHNDFTNSSSVVLSNLTQRLTGRLIPAYLSFMGSTHSAIAVANTILEIAWGEGRKLTPMAIQKHTFFAHGWYLGYTDRPLISDAVEAWRWGPVIPSLYHAFKKFKAGNIQTFAIELDLREKQICAPRVDNGDLRAFLRKVWEAYKPHDALALSAITHEVGSPWHETFYGQGGKDSRGAVIASERIASYYRAQITRPVAA